MLTWAQRFDWIKEHRGLKYSALGRKAGRSLSHVRDIVENEKQGKKVSPRADTLQAFAKAANVSYLWLSTGEGEPGRFQDTDAPSPEPTSAVVVRDTDDPEGPQTFGDLAGWPEAEAEARRLYDEIPGYAFEAARNQGGARFPRVVTAETVKAFAMAWLNQTAIEEKIRLTKERVRAELAAFDKDQSDKHSGG